MIFKYIKMNINTLLVITLLGIVLKCSNPENEIPPPPPSATVDAKFYLSKPDKSAMFAIQSSGIKEASENDFPTIEVNETETYQEMDGFGFSLTGGSAMLLSKMSDGVRQELLTELFDNENDNIGISYLRISVGSSDLDEFVFSYDDIPVGETDVNMEHFSIEQDRKYLIPMLKEILAVNREIKIMGSPWSAPIWMKTNGESIGGSLKPEYYDAYALYFVKYIQAMEAEGINIDAVTVQNEPLHDGNNPSMYMEAGDQADFVKNHMGPAFENAGITTKIVVYDHNADRIDYPLTILNDLEANKYVDGSAFHLYGGDINDLSKVHNAHPDKNLYFTEQWIGAPGNFGDDLQWHTRNLIIGATRNWCKAALEWNLASDPQQNPHTNGGCTSCLGAITIDGNNVVRNPAYYIIAHASKFVPSGSVRIESNMPGSLPNVAFKTPNDNIVIIVLNESDSDQTYNLKTSDKTMTSILPAGSVGTYVL